MHGDDDNLQPASQATLNDNELGKALAELADVKRRLAEIERLLFGCMPGFPRRW